MTARIPILLGVAATFLICTSVRSEVSVHGDDPVDTLLSGSIVEDSDPVGVAWEPMGPSKPGELQGSGGRPDIAFVAETQWPLAVWAQQEFPADHEIAFAEWKNGGWGATEILTSNLVEDLDPRIFIEPDGTVYIVWWRQGTYDEIYMSRRRPGFTSWDPAVRVSAPTENARRPSVAVFEGQLWVAYERDSATPGMTQDAVVALRQPGGGFILQVVASTSRSEALDVLLRSAAGKLWIDWKDSFDAFGCAQFNEATWGDLNYESWTDHTWVGVEEVRKLIQQAVVGD